MKLYIMTTCPFCKDFLPIFQEEVSTGEEIVLDNMDDPRWEWIEVVPTVISGDKRLQK